MAMSLTSKDPNKNHRHDSSTVSSSSSLRLDRSYQSIRARLQNLPDGNLTDQEARRRLVRFLRRRHQYHQYPQQDQPCLIQHGGFLISTEGHHEQLPYPSCPAFTTTSKAFLIETIESALRLVSEKEVRDSGSTK